MRVHRVKGLWPRVIRSVGETSLEGSFLSLFFFYFCFKDLKLTPSSTPPFLICL